jgi:hypothetical protein
MQESVFGKLAAAGLACPAWAGMEKTRAIVSASRERKGMEWDL